MTTNTAARPGSVIPAPNRWAVPLFLLGALALGGVLLSRPFWMQSERCERHELGQLRRQLEKPDTDPQTVIDRAAVYLDGRTLSPALQAQAHYLIGVALVRQARHAPVVQARDLWHQARVHLDQADKLGLTEEDIPALHYRQALCAHHTGMKPADAAPLLEASVAAADDPVEGYRLLADLHLRSTPPNLNAALTANEKLRQLPLLGEEVLGPARLQAGDILFQLGRSAEARKVLENVGRGGDPSIYARARLLRANSLMQEKNWDAAARLWQQIIDDPVQTSAREREQSQYQLGYCYWRLERFDDAAVVWEECATKGTEGSARAAALRVAELQLNGGEDRDAVEFLGRAVRDLNSSDDWPTALFPLDKARALFEHGCDVLGHKGAHELAVRVAEHYSKIAVAGRAAILRAERAQLWANSLTTATTDAKILAQRQTLHREAGRDYRKGAEHARDQKEQCEWLRRAGQEFLRGEDYEQAATVLDAFVAQCKDPALLGEGWYLLGQARQMLRQFAPAEIAYRESIKYPTRFAYRSRYQLSQLQLAQKNTGLAMETLEQNIKLLRLNPDNEALEKSLYSLATLLHQRQNYSMVPFYLDDALARFPTSTHALRGRYQLADAYRQLAAQENVNYVNSRGMAAQTREHHWKQHRHWLEKANEQFVELVKILNSVSDSTALQPQEITHVYFSAADCRFNLGDYAGALTGYEQLSERYRGRAEGIRALGGCVRCHAARNENERVQQRVEQIRLGLTTVDELTRKAWEGWLTDASKRYALASEQ